MQRINIIVKTSLVLLLGLWVIASGAQAQQGPIKIGFLGDFVAVTKVYTFNAYKAAQMAVGQINAQGGLLGRKVKLVKRDGGNDPQKHYDLVREMHRQDQVVAIFGGASSPCVIKASQACQELKIPFLVSIGNSQTIVVEKGHPFVFLFEPNAWMETKAFSIFATLMPWQTYGWLGPNYSWGQDIFKNFKQHFLALGLDIKWAVEAWHPLGTDDFQALIDSIIKAKPQALVVASWGEDMRHFVTQAKARGLFDQMAAFGWFSLIAGDSGRLLPEGIWTLSRGPFYYLSQKYPQTKRVVDDFFRRFGEYPLGFTVCCYDSFLAWREAVGKAGSTEPQAVAQALKGLQFTGLRGKSVIRALDGQIDCPIFFGRVDYLPEYPLAIINSVMEIPAQKTWLSEKEVLARRTGAGS